MSELRDVVYDLRQKLMQAAYVATHMSSAADWDVVIQTITEAQDLAHRGQALQAEGEVDDD